MLQKENVLQLPSWVTHLGYMWALPFRRACPDPDLQGLGSLPRLVNSHFAILADSCQAASIGAPGQAEDLKATTGQPSRPAEGGMRLQDAEPHR